MSNPSPPNRCRIVLVAPTSEEAEVFGPRLLEAVAGGDVASLIIPQHGDEASFQAFAAPIVRIAQEAGLAAIIVDDTRVAGRVGADGVHIQAGKEDLADAIERWGGKLIVGAGGAASRDDALELGELQPDYMFFGRPGFDTKPEPHPRNLALGKWWAEMVEISCIVQGGSDIASVEAIAATGAEFVALSAAVFGEGIDPREAVERANAILDRAAPRLEG
ncbi:thiamine phosphate synthase [Pseudaminobacter sp. 19-2017]|uniref:Thiamine phosphate synthase n=1 Tax=Pseudaminobacter soli (ex Zhang et al. 2022) TaxID=2831468 RepID=A0A942E3A0_9HYPH|nr:thiamine phosphate synthase [Pseudaminobacter soli]MBS3647727.1 thiamine phosphate synthase [Pseudaminobacter soli]